MVTSFLKSIFNKKRSKSVSQKKGDRKNKDTKSFREIQIDEEAYDAVNRGICSVPVKRIIGSVGRYQDFDSKFRIKQHVSSERLNNIKRAMRKGKRLPPVKLYQIKDDYYAAGGVVDIDAVIDGDVVAAGGELFIGHQINGDLVAAGGRLKIRGRIDDDVRISGGELDIDAVIGDDLAAATL